jgi:nitrite reductase/ring-hydroxylating ferredoxin subunit
MIFLCASGALEEGGKGVRFPVLAFGQDATGFAVRHAGQVRAYLNRCAHVPVELDWFEGEFFDSSKLYLMCSAHGALYLPETGACAGGPCRKGALRSIAVHEDADAVYWQPDAVIHAPAATPAVISIRPL